MKQYLNLLEHIMTNGNDRGSRAGGTRSVFGYQMRFDLLQGFPLLTTKKMATKAIVHELIWFLRGDTNIKYLLENDVHIWSADAYRVYVAHMKEHYGEHTNVVDITEFEARIKTGYIPGFAEQFGDLGPVYGAQWRKWKSPVTGTFDAQFQVDQLKEVIEQIKLNPEGRRHIVTAWNPAEIDRMALPPCHLLYQFYVHNGLLSCHMYQRSADTFLGVPFNIASYALLTHVIAQQTGLGVNELIISFGDVHIYNNHMGAVEEQLSRTPLALCSLDIFNRGQSIDDYQLADFRFDNYEHHQPIKAALSVGT